MSLPRQCLADRVEQYLDLGFAKLGITKHHDSGYLCTYKRFKADYHNLRADGVFADSNPKSWASGLLYIFCVATGTNRSQHDIFTALGTAPGTIRKYYKRIRDGYEFTNL